MSTYEHHPRVVVDGPVVAFAGSPVFAELDRAARLLDPEGPMIVVDTYPGTDLADLARIAAAELPAYRVVDVEDTAARPIAEIDGLIARNLTDDRVFGLMSHHRLPELYDPERLSALRSELATHRRPTVLLGWGAALVGVPDAVLVLADLARWEIQQRQRAGAPSWRCDNGDEDPLRKVKRGYFVEWRIADRHKVEMIFDRLDYVLDTTRVRDGEATSGDVTMIDAATFRAGLDQAVASPLRLVPFFDPGVWGGQWMRRALDLPEGPPNYAWCFDCVPEENSLLLQAGDVLVELPAMDLVLTRPRALMGERTVARFGAEFPIRFDFLDTVGGQNLSLQVHPSTEYIRDRFGMAYTQDESYYLLDAKPGAVVYLGLTDDTDPQEMMAALRAGQAGEPFEAERFVNAFPAAKHDHFSIPAGTVHCSGADSMVLEISATPYLFTFKMWDWDRLGLDGQPRPVHLDHAERNVAWERRTDWVAKELVGQVEVVATGPGWTEERTGLHALEFIEVRRHWFTEPVDHDTAGTVNVLNLVEGAEAVVESEDGAFAPFVVHYAETFIVPASVGRYRISPHGAGVGQQLGTLKAYVRGTSTPAAGLAGERETTLSPR